MGPFRTLATGLFVLLLPVALVTLNVRYAFNEERLWSYGFDRYGVERRTGLPRTEIDRAAAELRAFFNDDRETMQIKVVEDGHEVGLFTPREVIHLADVKALLRAVYRVQEVSLAYVLIYAVTVFIWAREMPVRHLARRALAASLLTLTLLLGFGAAALVGFERLFTQFHLISFSNDFWQLNPATDRLVQMFPLPFWQDATLFVAVLTVGEALLLAVASALYLGVTRARRLEAVEEGFDREEQVPEGQGVGQEPA